MNKSDCLKWAEAYFLMDKSIPDGFPFIASGSYERRMWLMLFQWAGWEAV